MFGGNRLPSGIPIEDGLILAIEQHFQFAKLRIGKRLEMSIAKVPEQKVELAHPAMPRVIMKFFAPDIHMV